MTQKQKDIIGSMIDEMISQGFGAMLFLEPIAKKHGLTAQQVYDPNTEQGIIAEYVNDGYISVNSRGTHYQVSYEMHDMLRNWVKSPLTDPE